jgi:uncharacterized membrane protein YsdA (DUF1294 family)
MELFSTSLGQILTAIFAAINIIAFLVMAHDKHKAARGHNAERAPEGFMFFMATLFGSIGVYLGMVLFRHKTRKWYFQIGIPLLILQNLATLYVIWEIVMR